VVVVVVMTACVTLLLYSVEGRGGCNVDSTLSHTATWCMIHSATCYNSYSNVNRPR
jgi:hypothetical protein